MNVTRLAVSALLLLLVCGCALQEIRSKTRGGPEYRHSGAADTNSDRWMIEQGVEFRWDNGVNTGVSYRRRDVDDGNGDNENLVMLELSFPLWKAKPKPSQLALRVERLEQKLAELETGTSHGETQ